MSRENVEVVRQPIKASRRSRRRLDERLLMRFPAALVLLARAVWRMPPRSWLRRKAVARSTRALFEAFNRRDYEGTFALYHPDAETSFPAQFASLGVASTTHGRAERIRVQRRWDAEWGEFRNDPEEVIDLGDRVLFLVRLRGSGLSSGVGFDTECAYLLTISGGRALREEVFLNHAEALKAAGLSE